jgi:hypothetical protein
MQHRKVNLTTCWRGTNVHAIKVQSPSFTHTFPKRNIKLIDVKYKQKHQHALANG